MDDDETLAVPRAWLESLLRDVEELRRSVRSGRPEASSQG